MQDEQFLETLTRLPPASLKEIAAELFQLQGGAKGIARNINILLKSAKRSKKHMIQGQLWRLIMELAKASSPKEGTVDEFSFLEDQDLERELRQLMKKHAEETNRSDHVRPRATEGLAPGETEEEVERTGAVPADASSGEVSQVVGQE